MCQLFLHIKFLTRPPSGVSERLWTNTESPTIPAKVVSMTEYQRVADYVRANPETDSAGTIRCPGCRTHLPPEEFYLDRARRVLRDTGRLRDIKTRCRACMAKAAAADPRKARRREVVREAKESGCVDCGLVLPDYPEVFEFDHVRPGKVKSVALWMTSGTEDDLRAEISRCDVVCANCHRIRTVNRPHGARYSDRRRLT